MAPEPSAKQEPHRREGDPKVIPPQGSVLSAGHFWLERFDFDGHRCGKIVLQWQPHARRWCLPDDYARGSEYNVEDYVLLGPCILPLFEHEQEELFQQIRKLDGEYNRAVKAKDDLRLTPTEWNKIRSLLYPMIK